MTSENSNAYDQCPASRECYSDELRLQALELSPLQANSIVRIPEGVRGGRVISTRHIRRGDIVLHEQPLVLARVTYRENDASAIASINDPQNLLSKLTYLGLLASQCLRKGLTAKRLSNEQGMKMVPNDNLRESDEYGTARKHSYDVKMDRDLLADAGYGKKSAIEHLLAICHVYCKQVLSPITQERCAWALYPYGSMFNHDCDPNLLHLYTPSCGFLAMAARDIEPGEELSISYTSSIECADAHFRDTILRPILGGECRCSSCRSETGQSRDGQALDEMPQQFEWGLGQLRNEKAEFGSLRLLARMQDNTEAAGSVSRRAIILVSMVEEVMRRRLITTPFWLVSTMTSFLELCIVTSSFAGTLPVELQDLYEYCQHLWDVLFDPGMQVMWCAKVTYLFVCIKTMSDGADWTENNERIFQRMISSASRTPQALDLVRFFQHALLSQLEHDGAPETVERQIRDMVRAASVEHA